MEKLLTIFILSVYVLTSHGHSVIANRRPIRSVLAPAETITDYETVSPSIIYQSEETTHGYPHDLWIKFDMPGETFELHLTMNKNLLSPKYTESSIEDGKTMWNKERKNCFYHGTVVGFAEWTVAMSTCAGLRGTFGDHADVDTLYHIEPLERTSNEIEQTHIVFGTSQLSVERRNGTCGCNESHRIVSDHHNFTVPLDRVRRQSATRIVEWVIFNDRRQFIAQGQSLSQTALHTIEIANVVDVLYAKIGVRVSLVGVQTWNQQDLIAVVTNPDTLLDNFHAHLRLSTQSFDSAMLITGADLDGNTIGLAPIGAMCRGFISAGLTQDTGSSVASVASTAAHELGHIFNMGHDDGRGCTCAGTNNLCIMAATLARPPPVEWSSCSVSDLNTGYSRGLDTCLFNEPTDIFGDPECGNGIREGDEVCDCGTPAMCDDPCCNANTCQLATGAVCSNREACCSNCQFRASGTTCRSANDECDITEYCTGTSGECPDDRSRRDGADCASGQAYCAGGVCLNLNSICNVTYAPNGVPSSAGPQECFNFNTAGTEFGNCGHSSTSYITCASAHVRCGQLHCRNAGDLRINVGARIRILTQGTFVSGQVVRCKSFTTLPGDDIMPGLVPDGARCGTNMLCRNRQCVARQLTACPSANSQECSGNGICNDLNQCSCNPGFTGTNCNSRVTGGRVDGGWTQWSSWSSCSRSCGVGSRTRTRSCTNPAPGGGGANCVGSASSTESCNIVACPVNGGWGSWSSWSSCSATCGGGRRTRQRSCNNPAPSGGGSNCVGSNSQQQTCNTASCPVNGGWGSWSSWSSCSVTCGGGQRTRQRLCNNPAPSGGGSDCVGSSNDQQTCNTANCPVNGGWGSWSSWSSCSVTCGGGQRTRQRSCNNPAPSGGGSECSGRNSRQQTCNTADCPVDGGWGSWSSWSSCSATCGSGQRARQRLCNNPSPLGGGSDCVGSNSQQGSCTVASCPVNGGWGSWTTWSSCSVTCGSGQRTRERFCNNPAPSGGGSDCSGSNSDQQACTSGSCPIDGQWGPFGAWSTCSQTCGGGMQTRVRSCDSPPPSNGGADCQGRETRQRNCNTIACAVNGGWGAWSAYSSCSVTCGGGQQIRRRVCDSPPASDGGVDCTGSATSQRACSTDACPTSSSPMPTTSCSGATCPTPSPDTGNPTSSPTTTTDGTTETDNPTVINPTADSDSNAGGNNTNVTRNSGGGSGGGSGAVIGGVIAGIIIIGIIVVVVIIVIVLYRQRKATKFAPVATSTRNEPDFGYRKPQNAYGFDNTHGAVYPTRSAAPPRPANPPPRPANPPPVRSYNPPPVVDQPSQPQRREPPVPPTKTQLYPQLSSPTQAPSRPQAPPKPQAPLKPQAPPKPQAPSAPPKPQAPSAPPKPQAPPKPEVAPRPKPREWPPQQSDNLDGRGPPPIAPKRPLRPPPRN